MVSNKKRQYQDLNRNFRVILDVLTNFPFLKLRGIKTNIIEYVLAILYHRFPLNIENKMLKL